MGALIMYDFVIDVAITSVIYLRFRRGMMSSTAVIYTCITNDVNCMSIERKIYGKICIK